MKPYVNANFLLPSKFANASVPRLPDEVQQLSAFREAWSLQPRVAEQVSRLQESMLALGMLLAAAGIAAYVRRRLSGQTESEVGRG